MYSIFLPTMVVYFCFPDIFAGGSLIGMRTTNNKAHGSAVINFLNMMTATVAVFTILHFHIATYLLPMMYLAFFIYIFFLQLMISFGEV